MSLDEQILRELRKLSKVTTLVNARALEVELSKYVNTPERRRMWTLIDGKRMLKDIAQEVNLTERAVNYFVTALSAADLVQYERGKPPMRLLDYTPANWLESILPSKSEQVVAAPASGASQATLPPMVSAPETIQGENKVG